MNILLADDDSDFLQLIEKHLILLGHQVIPAEDGAKALALYHEKTDGLDLVMTDIIMPGINGLELTRKIRAHNPSIPVVIISSFAKPEIIGQAATLNATIYQKPINFEIIETFLKSL